MPVVIPVTYPQTALRPKDVPISGVLSYATNTIEDTLVVRCNIVVNGVVENTEYVGEPGSVSEVGRTDFEFRYFQRWDVPSSVRVKRYFTAWQHDNRYLAAMIADFFNISDVNAVHALIEGRPA